MSRELIYDMKPLNIDPVIGKQNIVSRDSIAVAELSDGTIQVERRSDCLPLDRFISGQYVNLAAYPLRARDWTMVSGAAAVANEIASPWGTDRADMIAMAADAADGISQDITTETDTYNFSCYAMLDSGTGNVRLSNGTPGSNIAINSTSWTRIDGNFSCSAGTTTFSIINGSGASAQNVYLWGMQITKSKFPLRLVFGSNINKISKPLEFEDVDWTKTNLTPDDDGGSNGVDVRVGQATSRLTATADNATAASATFAVVAGDIFQSSITLKKSSGSGDVVLSFGDASDYADLDIDLDAGTVSTSAEVDITIIDSEIINYGSGWYRVNLRVYCSAAIAAAYTKITLATSGDIIDVDVCYGYIEEYNEHCMLTAPSDTTDLVSSYGFDNDEGFNDNTGANNGTNHGVVLQGDGGFKFDGASYNDTNGDSDYTQERTYVWLAKSTKTTKNCVFSHGSLLKGSLFFNYAGGETWWIVQSNVYARWSPSGKEDDGDWHLYSLYHKGVEAGDITHVELRIDGQLQTPIATPEVSTPEPWGDLQLGTSMPGDAWYYEGEIREFRYYNGHLSASRILDIYTTAMLQQPTLEYTETIAAEASAYTSDDTDVSSSVSLSSGDAIAVAAIIKRPSGGGIDDSREDGMICALTDDAGTNGVKLFLDVSETKISFCSRTGGSDDALLSLDESDINTAIDNGEAVAVFAMTYNGSSIVAAFTENGYLSGQEPVSITDSNDRILPAAATELHIGSENAATHLDACIPCLRVSKVLAQQGRLIDEGLISLKKVFREYLQQVV